MKKELYRTKIEAIFEELREVNVSVSQFKAFILKAVGFATKEVANETNVATSTAMKHLSNIKEKLPYNKDTELSGYLICKLLDVDYEEIREAVQEFVRSEASKLTMILCILSLPFFTMQPESCEARRTRRSVRHREKIETTIQVQIGT